jgi:hypothetical protein
MGTLTSANWQAQPGQRQPRRTPARPAYPMLLVFEEHQVKLSTAVDRFLDDRYSADRVGDLRPSGEFPVLPDQEEHRRGEADQAADGGD